jgi:hypothetical protein
MTRPASSGTAVFLQRPLCVSPNPYGRRDRKLPTGHRLDPTPILEPAQAIFDGRAEVVERRQLGYRTPAVGDDPFGTAFDLADEAAELCLRLADPNRQTLHVVIVVLSAFLAVGTHIHVRQKAESIHNPEMVPALDGVAG